MTSKTPKLGISQAAAALFAQQSIKLPNLAIISLLEKHYGELTALQIIETCATIDTVTQKPNQNGLAETLQLVKSILAVQIKKSHSSTGIRIEQDNDYLTCTELFATAIDTQPTQSESTQLDSKIAWYEIVCDALSLDITTNSQETTYIMLAQKYGLEATHELKKN